MKALSLRQVSNCEHAREKRCKCRCGGALHGIKRGDGEEFFTCLPENDPHYIVSKAVKKQRAAQQRRDAAERRYRALIGAR